MTIVCRRCGKSVQSFSQMRKWCVECRHAVSLEQARARKIVNRQKIQQEKPAKVARTALKLKV